MTFIPLPQNESGGQSDVRTSDLYNRDLLERILIEIKKVNIQLEMITGNIIKKSDISVIED